MECYICGATQPIDQHHVDCKSGYFSPETMHLCRRCHRTFHDLGIEWFDDIYLDRALVVENKHRLYSGRASITAKQIVRTNYWYKTHGGKRKLKREPLPCLQLPLPL